MPILFFRMTDVPKVEDIVSFFYDYVVGLGNSVLHSNLVKGEYILVENFSLPDNVYSRRLFSFPYSVLLEHNRDNFNRDHIKNPWRLNEDHCWSINGNLPEKKVFVNEVLDKYKPNLEENLRLAFQSFS